MQLNALTFIILAFASYRITRFFLFDSLIAHSRERYYVMLSNAMAKGNKFKRLLAHKLLELSSCSWCLGVWITVAVYWLYTWTSPLYWGRLGYITVAGLAGVQGLLHAFEPGDE